MRVLFSSIAFSGHLHPLLPFANALRAAGHEIAFAIADPFAPALERRGYQHFPAGHVGDLMAIYPEAGELEGDTRLAFLQRHVFGAYLPTAMLPALQAAADNWQPDLFVREDREYAACVVAERMGRPHAVVAVNAVGAFASPERLRDGLDTLRVSCGLAPDPAVESVYRYLRLCPFPPSLADPHLPVPATTHHIRAIPDDQSGWEDLPGWVTTLPRDRPIIYVGLGTVHNRPELFHTIIEGLRDEPLTLIVTVGRNLDPADFGAQPEHVRIERYIPLSRLLVFCDAAIINAGSGTLSATLLHGLPLVAVPVGADQPHNARRCEALGVGIALQSAEVTPERVRLAVRAILSEPRYREGARQLRAEIEALPGVEHAVELLVRLGRERRPLLPAG